MWLNKPKILTILKFVTAPWPRLESLPLTESKLYRSGLREPYNRHLKPARIKISSVLQKYYVNVVTQICHTEHAGCGWEWWRCVVTSLFLLETTWQADILQINEERWSISSGIRHSLNQCVISGYIVSIFFRAENPLSGFLNKEQTHLCGDSTQESSSAAFPFAQSLWVSQKGLILE